MTVHRTENPVKDQPSPGRSGSLSRELIADAALDLIDGEGLEALSMRRLASRLGVGTMTIYGYFEDKNELLDYAIDRAARDADLSPGEGDWRPRLRDLITTMWRSLVEHPSAVQIRSRRPILTPGALRAGEAGMVILREAGLEPREAAVAWRLLFTFVFGFAAFSSYEPSAELKSEWREQMSALPEEEYPNLSGNAAELVNWFAGEAVFEEALELLLDGIGRRLGES